MRQRGAHRRGGAGRRRLAPADRVHLAGCAVMQPARRSERHASSGAWRSRRRRRWTTCRPRDRCRRPAASLAPARLRIGRRCSPARSPPACCSRRSSGFGSARRPGCRRPSVRRRRRRRVSRRWTSLRAHRCRRPTASPSLPTTSTACGSPSTDGAVIGMEAGIIGTTGGRSICAARTTCCRRMTIAALEAPHEAAATAWLADKYAGCEGTCSADVAGLHLELERRDDAVDPDRRGALTALRCHDRPPRRIGAA